MMPVEKGRSVECMGQEYGCSHRNPCFVHRPHSNCCDRYHNAILGYFPGSLVCRDALWSGMSHPVTHGGPLRRPPVNALSPEQRIRRICDEERVSGRPSANYRTSRRFGYNCKRTSRSLNQASLTKIAGNVVLSQNGNKSP